MTTSYLLPHKWKTLGWVLLIIGLIGGVYLLFNDLESNLLKVPVFSIFDEPIIGQKGNFHIIENSFMDELTSILIIIGGLIVGFTKERIEDEYIAKLRTESLIWAIVFNYAVLFLGIVFVYGLSFFQVLVFNMFTPLLFFIIRFNFLKLKSNSDEE
ncbi:hypothetical protein [Gaetbulibacter aestuarii]|uniref:Uncharacterized protein n=1 Tax=Gaetbulibacter aestuarii TaxID=1502358 RepID=A0ABW7MZ32_9FLAO